MDIPICMMPRAINEYLKECVIFKRNFAPFQRKDNFDKIINNSASKTLSVANLIYLLFCLSPPHIATIIPPPPPIPPFILLKGAS